MYVQAWNIHTAQFFRSLVLRHTAPSNALCQPANTAMDTVPGNIKGLHTYVYVCTYTVQLCRTYVRTYVHVHVGMGMRVGYIV